MSKSGVSGSKSSLSKKSSGKGTRNSAGTDNLTIEEEENGISYLAWKIFSKDVLKELSIGTIDGQFLKIASVLNLDSFQRDTTEAVQVELFLTAYSFSVEESFTPEQTSAFLTLLHTLLTNCKDCGMSLAANLSELQTLIKGAGQTHKCPMGLWSRAQAERLLEYISTSFLQHYQLYEFIFTETQEEEFSTLKLPVPIPPNPASLSIPPLEEAVKEEFYRKYISPEEPQKTAGITSSPSEEDSKTSEVEAAPNPTLPSPGDLLDNIPPSELQAMLSQVVSQTVESFRSELDKRIVSSENTLLGRLTNLEKTV